MLDREQALALLNELGPEKHLIQHALASEAVMRALARHLGEDEEVWGLTGCCTISTIPSPMRTPPNTASSEPNASATACPKKPCTPSAPTTAR